jgi:multimeric flavodoxin WrbA
MNSLKREVEMVKVVAINGSPRKRKGNTAMVLNAFLEGIEAAGGATKLFYASSLKLKPCACGAMSCWYDTPGECCIHDDMALVYPDLKAADVLILATPVYVPLPSAMQTVLNKLCPLLKPQLEWREGRTRARLHDDVNIRKVVLVSTSDWWELGNFDTVIRIAHEFAENASVAFAGSVLRPHALLMKSEGLITPAGEAVLAAARNAGYELITDGQMKQETLDAVSQPLVAEKVLRHRYNQMV